VDRLLAAIEETANLAGSVTTSRKAKMAPEVLFKFANLFAVAGWICLITGIVTNRPWLRDRLAGLYWPLTIAAGYERGRICESHGGAPTLRQ
jgi:hypothetical protein